MSAPPITEEDVQYLIDQLWDGETCPNTFAQAAAIEASCSECGGDVVSWGWGSSDNVNWQAGFVCEEDSDHVIDFPFSLVHPCPVHDIDCPGGMS